MLEVGEIRALLILDLAVRRDLVRPEQAAAVLKATWARDGASFPPASPDLAGELGIGRDVLAPIEAEVDRLIEAADGDAALALSRLRGLDRSIFQALTERGPLRSLSPTTVTGAPDVALRTLSDHRYLDFIPAGEGGMGLVYMALDTELNRLVAFKMVRPTGGEGSEAATPFTRIAAEAPEAGSEASAGYEELKARFLQEAWVTGGLEHPGVVPVYELGQTEGGVPYYTMRFVGGQRTMKDALLEVAGAPIEARLALLEPFLKLCDTVRYAHSRRVIHRDLKPENVALGEFGEVVLLDWGLAKLEDSVDFPATHWQERVQAHRETGGLKTVAGAIGTPGYMAPEAALGTSENVDVQSDVYSLGVILFEILTGRRPFQFKNYAEFLSRISSEQAPEAVALASDAPPALSALCASCLAREPSDRPVNVEALSERIRDWQSTSALEREVQGHLRDARAALGAADTASADGRLSLVDRAAAALAQAAAKMPGQSELPSLQERGERLREEGLREREKASGRRLLLRTGVLVLALVAVAGYVIAAKFEARSLERKQDLQRILRLAAAKKVRDLEVEVDKLSSLRPDLVERTTDWLRRADDLVAGLPEHERALEELRALSVTKGPPWTFDTPALDWQHQVLSTLVTSLKALQHENRGARKRVLGLSERAAGIQERMLESEAAWTQTIAEVREHPRYGGLELAVQYGLVPLGADPDSGLVEFAHLGSGPPPRRDALTHKLVYEPNAGIVLVLIPGGTFFMGAQKEYPNEPNYEAAAPEFTPTGKPEDEALRELPVHERRLDPYLLAKHECTQAQWEFMTHGTQPSFYGPVSRNPVEQVSWYTCRKWLNRNGLNLPTEAQWEYGCRAGTQSSWWVGTEPSAIRAVAWTAETAATPTDDGEAIMWGRTTEVGTLRANAFGLHDVHGNVWEWCFDLLGRYDDAPVDEHRYGGYRIIRGGSWYETVNAARSAFRARDLPDYTCFHLGVRPARRLTTE